MNIMGSSILTVDQMTTYLKKNNPNAPESLATMFLVHGKTEGVRGDLAFCQALLETNSWKFGGTADISWKNTCGLGVTGEKDKGQRFQTWSDGILAQIQHLKAYASTEELRTMKLDERFHLVKRGSAKTIYELSNRWAMDPDYGNKIIAIYNAIAAIKIDIITEEIEVKHIIEGLAKFIQIDTTTWINCLLGKQTINPQFLKTIFLRILKVLK